MSYDPRRVKMAQKIAANPQRYRICEGCENILTRDPMVTICPYCAGYRFETEDLGRICAHANAIALRSPQNPTQSDYE